MTRSIVLVTVAVLLIGTLAVGAIPGDRSGVPVAGQQTAESSGFSGTIDASDADASFAGEAANDTAGRSVADVGDVNGDGVDDIVVGAPLTDTAGNNSGTAYLFYGPVDRSDLDVSDADATFVGEAPFDWAGWSVAGPGDLNGDGVDDLLIGAPLSDTNGDAAGAVYVVHGGSSLSESMSLADANATIYGGLNDRAGWSIASSPGNATDTSNVLIGALTDDDGGEEAGAAFLINASSIDQRAFLDNDASTKYVGESAGDSAGISVAFPGDVDVEGTDDALIGARWNDQNGNDSGAVYLASTGSNGTVNLSDSAVTMRGAAAGDAAGTAVAAAGDVNDDGTPDVLVGAPYNDSDAPNAGAAYVVFGGSDLATEIDLSDADVTLTGVVEGDLAGLAVASAGSDVTCDGVDDLLVGAPLRDRGGLKAGAAYLVAGDASLSGTTSLLDSQATFVGDASGDRFGYALGGAGDQNDDGVDDVLIGAPFEDAAGANETDAGAAYLFLGDCAEPGATPEEPTETPPVTTEPPTTEPATTEPPTTEPPTTVPPTTEPPTTVPPTTAPPTTEPPTTAPPPTEPPLTPPDETPTEGETEEPTEAPTEEPETETQINVNE